MVGTLPAECHLSFEDGDGTTSNADGKDAITRDTQVDHHSAGPTNGITLFSDQRDVLPPGINLSTLKQVDPQWPVCRSGDGIFHNPLRRRKKPGVNCRT